jgi:hypothetical protein
MEPELDELLEEPERQEERLLELEPLSPLLDREVVARVEKSGRSGLRPKEELF